MLITLLLQFALKVPCLAWAATTDIRLRQVELPDVNNFRRRAQMSIAVLGNYLYIDGGEISQFVDGKADIVASRPVNITASLPLDQPWTNTTVSLKSIKRLVPTSKAEALWADPDSNTMYAWGGEGPYGDQTGARNVNLWAFTPDNQGGGSWATRAPTNPAVFAGLTRNTGGTVASCNGLGFYLGGIATGATDTRVSGTISVPGLLTYDMKTGYWANQSATFPYQFMKMGQGTCLPFGSKGLVMFFAGAHGSAADADLPVDILLSNLTVYDPATNEWFWQLATGDIPDPRFGACSVGIQGPNGTFEIFIYGGYYSSGSPDILSNVYVLSLPAFRWFRADVQGTPRWAHACAVVGNRQMIVVGGVSLWTGGYNDDDPPADPWSQGLAILDLPTLSWSDKYDPKASAYDTPEVVKAWYSNGGQSSVIFNDERVKSMFLNGSTSSTPAPTTTSTSTSATASTTDPSGAGSKPSTGTIVGSVLGGVLFVVLLVFGARFLYRRWKRSHATNTTAQDVQHVGFVPKPELDAQQQMQHYLPPQELGLYEHGPQELAVPEHNPQELSHDAGSHSSDLLHFSNKKNGANELYG